MHDVIISNLGDLRHKARLFFLTDACIVAIETQVLCLSIPMRMRNKHLHEHNLNA